MGCISFGLPIYDSDLGRWIAYGIFMHDLGIHATYPSIMSFIIFTGSMEFVAAHFLRGGFAELKLGSLIHMVHAHEKMLSRRQSSFFSRLNQLVGSSPMRQRSNAAIALDSIESTSYMAKVR